MKIYRRVRTVAGHQYPTFEVRDYTTGRRQMHSLADHQPARKEARGIGDFFMSVIKTCRLSRINPVENFAALRQHAKAALYNPAAWLP